MLRMNGSHAMTLFQKMSHIMTMRQARRRTIVTCCHDSVVLDQNRAGIKPVTSGSRGNQPGCGNEIVIPRRAIVFSFFCHLSIFLKS